jgi:TATA-box binding protein (TBP) (component of TFIID and TFIIIB)
MLAVTDYIAKIEGICGAEKDIVVTLKLEKKDAAIANILKRSIVKKSGGFMFELEFQGVTFRVFSSGRVVFRGIKNKKERNRLLAALLL